MLTCPICNNNIQQTSYWWCILWVWLFAVIGVVISLIIISNLNTNKYNTHVYYCKNINSKKDNINNASNKENHNVNPGYYNDSDFNDINEIKSSTNKNIKIEKSYKKLNNSGNK